MLVRITPKTERMTTQQKQIMGMCTHAELQFCALILLILLCVMYAKQMYFEDKAERLH